MLIKLNLNFAHTKRIKSLLEIHPVLITSKKYVSNNQCNDYKGFFKFYSDDEGNFSDKYKPLNGKDYNRYISSRSAKREPALTRLITSLAYKVGKDMVSLAEGMPNEEVFPFSSLQLRYKDGRVLEMEGKELSTALQYLPSQGLPSLVTRLREFQELVHRPPPIDRDIIVTNGAQHAIYQCLELLLEPGDPVIISEYAYTGINVAMKPYSPEILGIPEDSEGLRPEALEAVLASRLAQGLKMPKLLYTVPTGNNPTGTVIPEDRRRRIYELACEYDFLILEDDPYMFLNYKEKPVPSFLSLDACGRVVRVDSLSKSVSAGLRAGWASAPAPLAARLLLHTQAEMLHTCSLAQAIVSRVVSDLPSLAAHLEAARSLYRARRDALLAALQAARAQRLADWTPPDAGLFLWVRVRGVHDVYNMVFHTAFQHGLMLIPGQAFLYDTSAPSQHIRLTFSKVPIEDMERAARILVEVIQNEQHNAASKRLQVSATTQ